MGKYITGFRNNGKAYYNRMMCTFEECATQFEFYFWHTMVYYGAIFPQKWLRELTDQQDMF